MMRPGWALLILLATPYVSGCAVVADVAGLAAGGSAGAATANPAVGYVVAVSVRAGVDELRKYVQRRRQAGEQDAIAEAAGAAQLGEIRPWEIRHTIPLGNERGELTVVREIVTPIVTCREVAFSVVEYSRPRVFTTPLCKRPAGWKWAAAEPATTRWGFLQ